VSGPRRFVAPEGGVRLDRFLAEALAGEAGSRSQVRRAIDQGLVRVDGRPAKAGQRLRAGAVVEVEGLPRPPASHLEPAPLPIRIVYEDEHLVVVDKPRGVVVHPAPGHWEGTLVHGLLHRYGGLEPGTGDLRPGVVHRLDKDTTGLLVVARTPEAGSALRRQLADRTLGREYLALVRGEPPERFTVDAPIGRDPTSRLRMAVRADGRPARTHGEVRERFPGRPPYALVALRLETGRTHQIRVHLASSGFPVAGDGVYGAAEEDRAAGLELGGQALHAWRLRLLHPATGEPMAFAAEPPPDFAAALERLRARGGTRR
jgi:23S rRNA pseudouridine1911/1915/1917 synthase